MQKRFAIGIPTINQYGDLLKETIQRYKNDFPNTYIFIVDNGKQNIPSKGNVKVFEMDGNLGVAGSWNYLLNEIFYGQGCSRALILNDDIYLGKKEIDIDKFLYRGGTWQKLVLSEKDWSVFFMAEPLFREVGSFDERFYPAYHEDNDYQYRISLTRYPIYIDKFFNPKIFHSSKSIEKDPTLNRHSYMKGRNFYRQKWGGDPGHEKFTTPFNCDNVPFKLLNK